MKLAPKSVRARAVTAGVLAMFIFGVALGIASYVLVSRLATASLTDVITSQIDNVAAQLAEHQPSQLKQVDLESVEASRPVFVQIVRSNGVVVAQTPSMAAGTLLCPANTKPSADATPVTLDLGQGPHEFLRLTREVKAANQTVVICAVSSMNPVATFPRNIVIFFLLGLPLVLLGVALSVWMALNRALGSVEDMRKQAQRMTGISDGVLAVQPTGDEIEHLGKTLNDLLSRLHLQSNTTRQFIADAGHELRNPIAALRVMLEFSDNADPASLIELERLEVLVSDLLTLATVDSQESLAIDTVEIRPILLAAVATQRLRFPGIQISVSLSPSIIQADGRAIRSALDNLLSNASRHAQSQVWVAVEMIDGYCRITIDDDGQGLSKDDCVRVFERFVRLDEARDRDEGGSGLGLAIVAAIAEAHGGTVQALPGPGGHFILQLAAGPALNDSI